MPDSKYGEQIGWRIPINAGFFNGTPIVVRVVGNSFRAGEVAALGDEGMFNAETPDL